MLRTLCSRVLLVFIVATLAVPAAAQDVSTSFEFTNIGDFTLGTSPKSVTFTGGRAQTLGVPALYREGSFSWMITPGGLGTITLETRAANVSFWYRNENASAGGVITVFDDTDQVVAVLNATNVFQNATFNNQNVKRITVANNAAGGGTRPVVAVDVFSYTADDVPTGDPPVATADQAETLEETAVTINVLANDSDPDGDPLSVTAASDPPNGSAVVNGDNTVTYTPDAGFFGQDSFSYTLDDGQGNQVQGQVTVTVTAFEPDLVFPQFVNGLFAGANSSRIVLRSTDDDENLAGFIRFRPTTGDDTVPVGGEPVIRVDFDIAPFGVFEINTDGTGDLQVGAVEVVVTSGDDSRIGGTLVFFILGAFVSVDAAPVRDQHQVFVSTVPVPDPAPDPDNTSEKAGIAAYNPDEENTATLRLVLLDANGIEQAAKTITLGPRTQLVKFVNESDADPNREFFPDFFAANPLFRGSLNITVTDGPDVAVVGLIQKGAGALIAVSTAGRAFNDGG